MNQFKRLALAMQLDNAGGICTLCQHKFIDVDDAIEREIICYSSNPFLIACRKCFELSDSKMKQIMYTDR